MTEEKLLLEATNTEQLDWALSTAYDAQAHALITTNHFPNVEITFNTLKSDSGRCQLCNTRILYRFHIHSSHIAHSAVVGSDCIEKFLGEEDSAAAKRIIKEMKAAKRAAKKAKEDSENVKEDRSPLMLFSALQRQCRALAATFSPGFQKVPCLREVSYWADRLTYTTSDGKQRPTKWTTLANAKEAYDEAVAYLLQHPRALPPPPPQAHKFVV